MKRRLSALLLIATIALFNSCQKEVSLENNDTLSDGLLQSDISGECNPMTVFGIYEVGKALVGTANYIDVEVDVLVLGSYTIYSDTVNGMFFRATGTFANTGLNTIRLPGSGTPTADDIHTFVITYGLTACSVDVGVLPAGGAVPADFEFDGSPGTCFDYDAQGTYNVGVAMTGANKIVINVDVITIGTYSITTTASNGVTFSGTGTLGSTGPATITLAASGTPVAAGTMNVSLTILPSGSTCSFQIDVTGPGAFTINCASAVPNGTYMKGVPLTAANTVDVGVTVTTPGSYTISGTANGMTFSKTGTFTAAGATTVTLIGAGTPTNDGTTNVTLNGGTASCQFPITVLPAVATPAVYAIQCGTAAPNGTWTVGTPLNGTNTVTVNVNVTTPGAYTITGTLNGITLTKTGVFPAAGVQPVTLTATGTPTTAGANAVPMTGGTPACNIAITVVPGAAATAFTIDCTSADVNGFYIRNVALNATNTIDIDVDVTVAGPYTVTGTINGMTFTKTGTFPATGVQTITLTGSGTPTAAGDFNVPMTGGTGTCTVEVTVFPNLGTWSFTQGATTFTGPIVDGVFEPTAPGDPDLPPGSTFLFITCTNSAQDVLFLDLLDFNGTVGNSENYPMDSPTPTSITTNLGLFQFEAGTPPLTLDAIPFAEPTNMIARVTTHNVATKTITGTFTGNAVNQAGNSVPVTLGTFTFTYP